MWYTNHDVQTNGFLKSYYNKLTNDRNKPLIAYTVTASAFEWTTVEINTKSLGKSGIVIIYLIILPICSSKLI